MLDHALFIEGTNVTFEDWKSMSIKEKKQCLLSSLQPQQWTTAGTGMPSYVVILKS